MLILWSTGTLRRYLPVKRHRSPVDRKLLASLLLFPTSSSQRSLLSATLQWRDKKLEVAVLLDSGSDESLIDTALMKQLKIPIQELPQAMQAHTLTGQPLAKVRYITVPVSLLISGNHCEEISLHLIDTPQVPVILGYPWLLKHNPHIDWTTNAILGWSTHCLCSVFPQPCPQVVSWSLRRSSRTCQQYRQNTWNLNLCSASPVPLRFHHTVPSTVPSTYYLEHTHLRLGCTL